jgi:hypothetical protein
MIHLAGPFIGLVQRCLRCDAILIDYRDSMVPADDPRPLRGWPEGASVDVYEGWPRQSIVTDEPPNCVARH